VRYRERDARGTMSGGPMYYLTNGLGWRWLAVAFAIFGSVAAFGIGNMVQSNSVADVLVHSKLQIPVSWTGLLLTAATALVILGGIRSIGRATSFIVPLMIVLYMGGGIVVVLSNWRGIDDIFRLVLEQAFTGSAATGGFLGAALKETIRYGVARGVFSNESGLGSAPIAAAAAQTTRPAVQALVSMTQTFIDTLVVCSITGFAIIGTGAWTTGRDGSDLTRFAFSHGLPGESGGLIVALGLVLFAYSTILGWSYYGEKCLEYLLGPRAVVPYRVAFCAAVFLGAVAKLELVWQFADTMNALMALPNLIGLLALSGVVVRETRSYLASSSRGAIGEDTAR